MGAQSIIEVRDLNYRYPGAKAEAVRGVSFEVRQGEVFGFLGPSGAGKSTVQKILIRLLQGYKGQVTAFGRDLESWGDEFYERVGVSFELPANYLKLTGRENLELFASLYSGEIESPAALLELVDLGDAANRRVSEYSKGMQLRLNFARSLLNKPELLFLDEPTGGLDPVSARRIKQIVRDRQAGGATVFLTTHDMVVADELCDRVGFIVDGEIPVIAEPRALKLEHGEARVRVEYRTGGGPLAHESFALNEFGGAALDELRARGDVAIETIHTEEATLEQVFIAVTGRALR